MLALNWFKCVLIFLSFFITLFLAAAIGSLFFIPSPSEIWLNFWSEEILFSLKLSLWTSLLSTLLVVAFSIPIGYSLSRFQFWGKSMVKTIIDLPIAFPEIVLGLYLLSILGNTALVDFLEHFGIKVVFTKQGIVVGQFFTALPYAIRIIKSTFDYINPRLEFVSRSLGYSLFETFVYVSIPLAKSGLLAATIIAFARSIGTFGTVLILTGGSYMKTEVLPVTLYLNVSYGNISMAMTSGIVLVVVSFLAILVFEKTDAEI